MKGLNSSILLNGKFCVKYYSSMWKSTSYLVASTKVSYVFWNRQVIGWLSDKSFTKVSYVLWNWQVIGWLLVGRQSFIWFFKSKSYWVAIKSIRQSLYVFWNQRKSFICFLKSTQKFHMFFEIDKLFGGNYKSFICFLKSTSYWLANNSPRFICFLKSISYWVVITKVSYVF